MSLPGSDRRNQNFIPLACIHNSLISSRNKLCKPKATPPESRGRCMNCLLSAVNCPLVCYFTRTTGSTESPGRRA
jgi:hypothetical protein